MLTGIWCDTFDLDRVGPHDDFFELGGHSLLAIRMASRLREALGLRVPVRLIMENPTPSRLAELIVRSA